MNSIIKRLIVLNNKHKNKETFKILKKHKFYYDIGDIIKYDNKTFYVYDLDKYNLYTHQVYYSIKSKHIFIINGTSYAFNFENTKVISLKKRIKLVDIVKVDSQSFINNYKNRFLRELKEKHSSLYIELIPDIDEIKSINKLKMGTFRRPDKIYHINRIGIKKKLK